MVVVVLTNKEGTEERSQQLGPKKHYCLCRCCTSFPENWKRMQTFKRTVCKKGGREKERTRREKQMAERQGERERETAE